MHSRHPALGAFSHFLFLFARQLFLWPSPFLTPPPFFDQVREFVPLGAIIGQCGTRPPAPSTCLRFFFIIVFVLVSFSIFVFRVGSDDSSPFFYSPNKS